MKQYFAYFFLLISFFYVGGYFIIFKVSQVGIYREMEKSKKNIEILVIPTSYFLSHQERDGKEIRWGGKMFDIKLAKQSGNKHIVYAIHDTKEELLLKKLTGFTEGDSKQTKMPERGLSKILKLEFVVEPTLCLQNQCIVFRFKPIKTIQTHSGFLHRLFAPPRTV